MHYCRLLIIDTAPDHLAAMEPLLLGHLPECQITGVHNLTEGLDQLSRLEFDGIVVETPENTATGLEICRALRSHKTASLLPLLLIIPQPARDPLRQQGDAIGINDFIAHPIDYAELAAKIRTLFRLKHTEDELRSVNMRLEELVRERTVELEESRRKLVTLMSNLPGMVYRCCNDRNWTMEFVSGGCFELTGYRPDQLIGGRCIHYADLIHRDDMREVWEQVQQGLLERRPFRLVYRIQTADGQEKWVWEQGCGIFENGEVEALEGFITDITERKLAEEKRVELEAQLHQAQKMEAVGQLSSGIAHDFNNLLTVILGSTDLIRRKISDEPTRAVIDAMEDAARQAAGITRALLTFSRKVPSLKEPVDLNQVVQEAGRFLKRMLSANIEFELQTSPEPIWVSADPIQLQQVVLNLAINARDAMQTGGRLTVKVDRADPQSVENTAPVNHQHARISVSDTGSGMPANVLEHIFEPFYSTKPRGQGTGLGLSITHGIVEDHGGTIEVQSIPGEGSTFMVYLPVAERKNEHAVNDDGSAIPRGQGQRILLAEDHQEVREMLRSSLVSLGYQVHAVGSGAALMETWRDDSSNTDLCLMDDDLPGRSGLECLKEIRRSGATLPIILMTGSMVIDAERDLGPHDYLLCKPFNMTELARLVGQILRQMVSHS